MICWHLLPLTSLIQKILLTGKRRAEEFVMQVGSSPFDVSIWKFISFKIQEQNTFWSFITDAPHFRYGGSFVFDKNMQDKAEKVREAIAEFELALEQRQEPKKENDRGNNH